MVYRNKSQEEIPEESTVVWSCTSDNCKGWMRDNFAFEHTPKCTLCDSPMTKDTKMLPLLVNTNADFKSLKKGVSIQSKE
jgi:hypothetical protein